MPRFRPEDILREVLRKVEPDTNQAGKYLDLFAYKDDPVGYAREILKFNFWAKQEEMARAVATHKVVRVNAGHGVGKTSGAAAIVNWFLDVHDPALVLTTAPTWNQVRTLLWKEIRTMRRGKGLPGRIKQTEIVISDDRFAIGLSTDDETRFQGHHSPNILVVIDEGPGVDPKIFAAIEGIRVGENNKVLSLGNPISPNDPHEMLKTKRGAYAMRISSLEHPNVVQRKTVIPGAVTWDWVDEHVREWCEEVVPPEDEREQLALAEKGYFWWDGKFWRASAIAMSKILGLPPPQAEDQIISLDLLEAAHRRWSDDVRLPNKDTFTIQLGADIARFGADENVVYENWGGMVMPAHVWGEASTVETANRIWKIATAARTKARQRGVKNARVRLLIDEGGVGGGVVDQIRDVILRKENAPWFELVPIQFGGAPSNGVRYANKRAEMYYYLRDALKDVGVPRDDRLDRELLEHRYRIDNTGRIQIESKEAIKRRLGRSPDRADAFVLAVFQGETGSDGWAPGLDALLAMIGRIYRPND